MKRKERDAARKLRQQGKSINEIVQILGVAKSSVSIWVRDVKLSSAHLEGLSKRGRSKLSIEKRRQARLTNTRQRKQAIQADAKLEVGRLSKRELWLVCTALYWGEGAKKTSGTVALANTDPDIIRIWMRFVREILKVPEDKMRGHLHIHKHLDSNKAKKYWSLVSGIPENQFIKIHKIQSRAAKNKKDSQPLGTFTAYFCDTIELNKILGWIEGLKQ